ncbi:SulP family inorganic anion transporter [Allomuricauda sp. CP2A]|jgi:SulP family sulfate permease|uniref:SulP family inorganic anion transporter n=1 Tax=Allomuricauda sp. CP2A TaxID=1848189 RepID=UPI000835ADF0|nr:SulP family inorganic anion transporter [Muricauda sp. CP2A]
MKNFFSNLRGDIFGGLTAGIVALPLALAFGVSSGMGPSAGLYGAIFISFFAALFGGTNTQISGPTAPMTAVSMVVVTSILAFNDGDFEKALPAILMVFLMAGLVQIGLGLVGIGKYIRYIPYPVVSGFMTAIGIIILATQILPLVGYYPKEDLALVDQYRPMAQESILRKILKEESRESMLALEDFQETIDRSEEVSEENILKEAKALAGKDTSGVMGAINMLPRALQHINWLELALAFGTIVIIYGFKKITASLPSALVALLVVSGVAYGLGLDYRPIEQIPGGFPIIHFDMFTQFRLDSITPYVFTAFTLALLGAIDSLLTSVVADNMTKTQHRPNKELIGQGIGNSIAAFFGGLPGAGATIRTVVNINAGGKTKLSGMVAGVLLLTVLLALGPVASKIPAAVLAGILVTVGIGVMDYKGLKAIPFLPRDTKIGPFKVSSEVIIMLVVIVLSTVWNLVYAVGVGLVLASLMFMKKMGDLTAERSDVKTLKEEKGWADESNFPKNLKKEVFIKHLKGPLFFGFTSEFQQLAKQIPRNASTVIIRMDRMQYLDQSGIYTLEDVLIDLKNSGIEVLFVGLLGQPRYMMERVRLIPSLISENRIFIDFKACTAYLKSNLDQAVDVSKEI